LQDVYKTAEQIRAAGGTITKEPGPASPNIPTKICATTDPDGWKIVLVSALWCNSHHDIYSEQQDECLASLIQQCQQKEAGCPVRSGSCQCPEVIHLPSNMLFHPSLWSMMHISNQKCYLL